MSASDDSDEELRELLALRGPGLYEEKGVKKKNVNNEEGLLSCLEAFSKSDLPWVERLDVTAPAVEEGEKQVDEEDDFKREIYIYEQAQAAVLATLPQLKEAGIPTRRPDDYLAEMAKSDEHMSKVRARLLSRQKAMENKEKARQLREMRKKGKKIQQEVLQQRQKEKKEFLQSLKNLKEKRRKLKDQENEMGNGSQPSQEKKSPKMKKNRKRMLKNAKYGFGGQKKRSKRNDSDSARSGERMKKMTKKRPGAGGKRPKGKVRKKGR